MGRFSEWFELIRQKQDAAILMGKQTQVDKINARNRANGKDFEVFLDDNGKLQKRRVNND